MVQQVELVGMCQTVGWACCKRAFQRHRGMAVVDDRVVVVVVETMRCILLLEALSTRKACALHHLSRDYGSVFCAFDHVTTWPVTHTCIQCPSSSHARTLQFDNAAVGCCYCSPLFWT